MGKVVVLCGPSGCGKSTFAKMLVTGEDSAIVSADNYFVDQATGVYKFNPFDLPRAHAACMSQFLYHLTERMTDLIVVDNTNIARWERMNYEAVAKAFKYEVETHAWVAETVQDIWTCAKRNSHGVPAEAVARMSMNMEISAASIIHKVTA